MIDRDYEIFLIKPVVVQNELINSKDFS